jgi:hypothetical protein
VVLELLEPLEPQRLLPLLVQQVRVDLLWLSQQRQLLELDRFYPEDKTQLLVVLLLLGR